MKSALRLTAISIDNNFFFLGVPIFFADVHKKKPRQPAELFLLKKLGE